MGRRSQGTSLNSVKIASGTGDSRASGESAAQVNTHLLTARVYSEPSRLCLVNGAAEVLIRGAA